MDYNQDLGKHLITEEILTVPMAVLHRSNINLLQLVMSRINTLSFIWWEQIGGVVYDRQSFFNSEL